MASGLSILYSRLHRLHPLDSCVNRNEKIVLFMDFHNSCTHNGNHLTVLINAGNAHKQRMLSQTTVSFILLENCVGEKTEKLFKMLVAAKCWLFSQLHK